MEFVDRKPASPYVIKMWRFPFSIVEYGEVTPLYAIMSYKGVEIKLHSFLTSAVNGGEKLASHVGRCSSHTHRIRDWVGPTVCLDPVNKR